MKFENNQAAQPVIQREMPFFMRTSIEPSRFAPAEIVSAFSSYRDAVVWCWKNRPHRGKNDPHDQSMFACNAGVPPSHMSRFVNSESKAPMDLKPDYIEEFENYCGWHAVTQYLNMKKRMTIMEEVIEQRRAA